MSILNRVVMTKNLFQIRIRNSIEEGIVKSMKQINELGR